MRDENPTVEVVRDMEVFGDLAKISHANRTLWLDVEDGLGRRIDADALAYARAVAEHLKTLDFKTRGKD